MLRYAATACALSIAGAGFAQAGDTLTDKGATLTPVFISAGAGEVRRSVDLAGDVALETYVTALTRGGAMLARTRNGYWLPWSGRPEDLGDSGFAAANGSIEFKILKEELSAEMLPVTVTIGYRTGGGVKFGSFEIRAK